MTLARVVFRLPHLDREALDDLRRRYFDETGTRLSRASVARVLLSQAIAKAVHRRATDVLPSAAVARAVVRKQPTQREGK